MARPCRVYRVRAKDCLGHHIELAAPASPAGGHPHRSLPPHLSVTKQEIEDATKELNDLVQKFCGGNITCRILDEKQPETDL
jgi:hypothetical protein